MDKEELKKLMKIAIENDFNEITISQIVFLYFKDDMKTIKNYDKIRIGISEEIFNLFINFADDFNKNAKEYEENTKEWRENREMYVKINNLILKLKDAKIKDNIMKIIKKTYDK
jgi:hypothetical protein